MTDLELLEAAALAIGHRVVGVNGEGVMLEGVQAPWSPLTDDGDAFRLAVRLNIVRPDEYAAARRAIVRAAAMPTKDE